MYSVQTLNYSRARTPIIRRKGRTFKFVLEILIFLFVSGWPVPLAHLWCFGLPRRCNLFLLYVVDK